MSALIEDYDLRCAVRDALKFLEDHREYCDRLPCQPDGECYRCAEDASLEYTISQLKRGLGL